MPFPGKPSPVIQKPLTLSTTMYTLRQKLVLATVVVFSIATLSILAATRWIVMDAVAMETTRAGARSASLLSAAVTPLLIQSDMASLDELTQSLVHSGDFSHLQVIDRLGEVVATAGTRSETDSQIFSHDLELGGQAYGRATFGIARTGEHAVAKHVLGELLLVCLGTLALGAAVQVYIAHALTARLATLRSGADRMAAGEANVQIDSIGTDELAMLAAAFNRMSTILSQRFSALEEAERMLKEYSESLERRVSERTNHLEQTLLQLRQAQDELVEAKKLSSLGNLVAGISHELNTPIGNAITTTTSLQHLLHNTERTVNQQTLTRKGLLDALGLGQQMADLVLKATQKAATLVSSFKRVAAHDTGQRRKPFDLATLVSGTVAAWVKDSQTHDWAVEVDIPQAIVMDSFPDSLAQVVVDLLENADRHAFEGTENGLLRISAVASHTQVEIRLTDNGPGMSEDVAARVFEPFFTTKMGQGGPGLGLSIARNQVGGLLGGRISVESACGVGTCVVLTLPLSPAAHPPQAHTATTQTPHSAWRSDHEPDTQP